MLSRNMKSPQSFNREAKYMSAIQMCPITVFQSLILLC